MPKDRGKWEKKWLNQWEREQRDHLPEGIGLEYSPLLDFKERPWQLLPQVLRYFYVADSLLHWLTAGQDPRPLKILDVGCGYGEMLNVLQGVRLDPGYTRSYLGIDGDPNRIKRAKIAFPRSDFRLITLPEGLSEITEYFEGFVCSEVMEHLNREDGFKLMDNLRWRANPGSVAVFTAPAPEVGMRRKNPLHLTDYPVEDFLNLAKRTAWEVVDWFWLKVRATELPERSRRVPYDLYQPTVSPLINDPNVRGSDALYVLRAATR